MKVQTLLAAIAGSVAMQAAIAQVAPYPAVPGVSMTVTGGTGTVGVMCEPFACVPNALPVSAADLLVFQLYGLADNPYILFAGAPSLTCLPLGWVLGELACAPPWLIIDVGLMPNSKMPNACGLDTAVVKLGLADPLPLGAQLTLQLAAWPFALDMPAFSRGVLLTVQ